MKILSIYPKDLITYKNLNDYFWFLMQYICIFLFISYFVYPISILTNQNQNFLLYILTLTPLVNFYSIFLSKKYNSQMSNLECFKRWLPQNYNIGAQALSISFIILFGLFFIIFVIGFSQETTIQIFSSLLLLLTFWPALVSDIEHGECDPSLLILPVIYSLWFLIDKSLPQYPFLPSMFYTLTHHFLISLLMMVVYFSFGIIILKLSKGWKTKVMGQPDWIAVFCLSCFLEPEQTIIFFIFIPIISICTIIFCFLYNFNLNKYGWKNCDNQSLNSDNIVFSKESLAFPFLPPIIISGCLAYVIQSF